MVNKDCSSARTEDKTTSRSQRLVIQLPSGRRQLANPSRSKWQRLSGQSPGSSRRSATQPSWLNSVDHYQAGRYAKAERRKKSRKPSKASVGKLTEAVFLLADDKNPACKAAIETHEH